MATPGMVWLGARKRKQRLTGAGHQGQSDVSELRPVLYSLFLSAFGFFLGQLFDISYSLIL
jgi:hypothetical protein